MADSCLNLGPGKMGITSGKNKNTLCSCCSISSRSGRCLLAMDWVSACSCGPSSLHGAAAAPGLRLLACGIPCTVSHLLLQSALGAVDICTLFGLVWPTVWVWMQLPSWSVGQEGATAPTQEHLLAPLKNLPRCSWHLRLPQSICLDLGFDSPLCSFIPG